MSLLRRALEARAGRIPQEVVNQLVRLNAQTSSGIYVDGDSALRHSAVWACVNKIAQPVEMMPLDVIRYIDGSRREVSPTPQIVAAPSVNVDAPVWRYQVIVSLLTRGNAWGIVTSRDRSNHPTRIELLHPDDIRWWYEDNRVRFEALGEDRDLFPVGDLWHLPAYTLPGTQIGLSPIAYAAQAIGAGIAAERFGSEFFGGGGHPTGILTTDKDPGQDAAERTKTKFEEAARGRGVVLLPADVRYQQIQISPEDSQFIDAQRFTVEQVCRVFGVPPEMVASAASGSSLTYANREERTLDFLAFTLQPWLTKIERALSVCLPNQQQVKFNADVLLRTSTLTRYRAHSLSLHDGWRNVNEVRALEDLPPVDGGDVYDVSPRGSTPPVKLGEDSADDDV